MFAPIDHVRRLLLPPPRPVRRCLVCHGRISDRDRQLRLRGNAFVHQHCATYRMRQVESGAGRLGYPPR
jgi:hypothetical protein